MTGSQLRPLPLIHCHFQFISHCHSVITMNPYADRVQHLLMLNNYCLCQHLQDHDPNRQKLG